MFQESSKHQKTLSSYFRPCTSLFPNIIALQNIRLRLFSPTLSNVDFLLLLINSYTPILQIPSFWVSHSFAFNTFAFVLFSKECIIDASRSPCRKKYAGHLIFIVFQRYFNNLFVTCSLKNIILLPRYQSVDSGNLTMISSSSFHVLRQNFRNH